MSTMLSMTLATELYVVPEFLACIPSGPFEPLALLPKPLLVLKLQ